MAHPLEREEESPMSRHICPRCGGRKFYTPAHVAQDWLVDEYGNYIETFADCTDVVAPPEDGNNWQCAGCGALGVIVSDDRCPA